MRKVVLKVENVSKQYRLGVVGTGTLSHDLNRWWHSIRGKEDPYLNVGEENKRDEAGGDYVWALKDINFEVKQGEVLGIIGKNGAGKSTLLKLLSQITTPTTGNIKIKGRIAALLEVGTGFHPELTGRENVFLNGAILGMTKKEISSKFDEIVAFSGVEKYIDTPVKRYSSGMMVRLGFAVAAHLEPEILVVDEVLAVGDAEFQKKCIGKMKDVAGEGRTVLFVSHNLASIKTLCTKGVYLKNGEVSFVGDINTCIDHYLETKNDLISSKTYPDDEHRPSTNTVELMGYKLHNSKGELVDTFNLYEDVCIEINYKVKSINGECYPNIHFFDKNDNSVLGESISYDSTPKTIGIYSTKFAIPAYTFNVGIYSVGIAVTSYPGVNVHFNVNPALVFEVTEEDLSLRHSPLRGVYPGVTRFKLHNETLKLEK